MFKVFIVLFLIICFSQAEDNSIRLREHQFSLYQWRGDKCDDGCEHDGG